MKLFTEKQVLEILSCADDIQDGYKMSYKQVIEQFTPIEIPSDEVIKHEAITQMEEWSGSGCEEEIFAFIKGAKWVINKIKNQQ